MTDPVPTILVFIGIAGLLAYWISCRRPAGMAGQPAHPGNTDSWTTPFYLRSNTPVFDGTQAIQPSVVDSGWSLATYFDVSPWP